MGDQQREMRRKLEGEKQQDSNICDVSVHATGNQSQVKPAAASKNSKQTAQRESIPLDI